jgi:hypothetical protein
VNRSPIFCCRLAQFLRITASVAVSTRSLKGLGLAGLAGSEKGCARQRHGDGDARGEGGRSAQRAAG